MRPWIPTTAQSRASAAPAAMSVVGILAHFALDADRAATRSNAHPTRPVGAGGTQQAPASNQVLVWGAHLAFVGRQDRHLGCPFAQPTGHATGQCRGQTRGAVGLPTYAVAPANVAFRPSLTAP